MKNFLFLLLTFFALSAQAQTGHKIEIEAKNVEDGPIKLAYRRGEKVYAIDTVDLVAGKAVFEGAEPIAGGIYLVLFPPDNNWFEMLVNDTDQEFKVLTEGPNFGQNLTFLGSDDNMLFSEYKQFISERSKHSKEVKAAYDAEKSEKKKAKLNAELDKISAQVRAYQDAMYERNPDHLSAKLVKVLQEPLIPEPPVLEDGKIDSTFRFRYFKQHFFEDFEFTDASFVRTIFQLQRVDKYLDDLTVQSPDSVIVAVDYILQKAEANETVFKSLLPHILNKYYRPKIMGLDAAFVHIAYEYYAKGKADWVSESARKKILQEAYMNRGVLIGAQAPDVAVQKYSYETGEFTEELMSPYDVKEDYTVVFLWKPGCPACKKMSEELASSYDALKEKGVEVFSISSAKFNELEKAQKDVVDKGMKWIVTADPKLKARALQNYYGTSLPKLYVLDKDKKIIANRIGPDQILSFIENHESK